MNGDGYLDLVAGVLRGGYGVFYYEGNGTDTVKYVKAFGSGQELGQGSMADIDQDGDFDLIYTQTTTYTSKFNTGIMLNTGNSTSPVIQKENKYDLVDVSGERVLTNHTIRTFNYDKDDDVELLYVRPTSLGNILEGKGGVDFRKNLSIEILDNKGDNTFYPVDTLMSLDSVDWNEKFSTDFCDLNGDGILDMIYIFRSERALYVKWGSYKDVKIIPKSASKGMSSISIYDNVLKLSEKHVTLDKNISVYSLGGKLLKDINLSGVGSYDLRSFSLPKGVYVLSLKLDGLVQYIKWQNND